MQLEQGPQQLSTASNAALAPMRLGQGLPTVYHVMWVRTTLALERLPVPLALQVRMQLEQVQPTASTAALAPMHLGQGLPTVYRVMWVRTTLALELLPVPLALQVRMQLEQVQPTASTAVLAPTRLGQGLPIVRGAVGVLMQLALAPGTAHHALLVPILQAQGLHSAACVVGAPTSLALGRASAPTAALAPTTLALGLLLLFAPIVVLATILYKELRSAAHVEREPTLLALG